MPKLQRIVLVLCAPAILLVVCAELVVPAFAQQTDSPTDLARAFDDLESRYKSSTQAILAQYCNDCHSAAERAGELDLEAYASFAQLRANPKPWLRVRDQLAHGEMPPKDAPQPTEQELDELRRFVADFLHFQALSQAGDPGPVLLRRLSNAEYTFSIQDLTGLPLEPAAEFPVDGAAGEGFANTGAALVMSPSLVTKYVDAAKEIADHLVLLPDGIEFSSGTSRRDFTDERLATLHRLYNAYADEQGKIPFERYLNALVFATQSAARDPQLNRDQLLAEIAQRDGLSLRFLKHLEQQLNGPVDDPLLGPSRRLWQIIAAEPEQDRSGLVAAIASQLRAWQTSLVRFQNVGHLKPWQVNVDPLTNESQIRIPIAIGGDGTATIRLEGYPGQTTNETSARLVWINPRLVGAGRPELPLSQVRDVAARRSALRQQLFASTQKALAAIQELERSPADLDLAELGRQHDVEPHLIAAWASLFGLQSTQKPQLDLLTQTITSAGEYPFVQGFGSHETPLILASSSDQFVRIPGRMKPHGVVVHPAPTLKIAVGWLSPLSGQIDLQSIVTHAHPECGNGVVWSVELRRGTVRRRLVEGVAQGDTPQTWNNSEPISVLPGDLISLIVGPRDGNHSCDLTDLQFQLVERGGEGRKWNLNDDLSPNILQGNPHADALGNAETWSFYTEAVDASSRSSLIPNGSLLDRWWNERDASQRQQLAQSLEQLLLQSIAPKTDDAPGGAAEISAPDRVLLSSLNSLGAPWFATAEQAARELNQPLLTPETQVASDWALPTTRFGSQDEMDGAGANDLVMPVAPNTGIDLRLPADLAAGCELVAEVRLVAKDSNAVVQPRATSPLAPYLSQVTPGLPLLVIGEGAELRQRLAEFRRNFPAGLCYTQIVPVDEVVTLALFHREDDALAQWFLTEEEQELLNRTWEELHFVSRDALTTVDAFQQLMEYATQDSDPGLFEPFREPIHRRAAEFLEQERDAESVHLSALIRLAQRAYRRDLTAEDEAKLRALYQQLRGEELPHEEALKMTLVRILVSPQFLFKLESPAEGLQPSPITSWELATRLSYFLWASAPDEALLAAARDGSLNDDAVLLELTRKMLDDPKTRRMAIEFGTRYLHVYDFENHDEKSEQIFPEFLAIRAEMQEEVIQNFEHLLRENGSVLDLFGGDHTYLNESLANFYQVPGVSGENWRRVDGVQQFGRGGVLGLGATLAKQSGASRTSPILRGNWVSEVLLGERLPKPPAGVPPIPDDGTLDESLTMRQIVERHTQDPNCVNCHRRIDPIGFALEGFDAIGRRRTVDDQAAGDLATTLMDGSQIEGLEGLRRYLTQVRLDDVEQVFCRKLLGYALGREVQLSDQPLIDRMLLRLREDNHAVHGAIFEIVLSPQFRQVRGRDVPVADVSE